MNQYSIQITPVQYRKGEEPKVDVELTDKGWVDVRSIRACVPGNHAVDDSSFSSGNSYLRRDFTALYIEGGHVLLALGRAEDIAAQILIVTKGSKLMDLFSR